MKNITRKCTLVVIVSCVMCLSSCVSAIVDSSTNQHREILNSKASRVEFREELGKPIDSWMRDSGKSPKYSAAGMWAYDVFTVRGVVARPGDGAAQTTVNAVTLGAGEVIALPFTLVGVAGKPFSKQTLVVFYDRSLVYTNHSIYDRNGKEIDKLGY